MRIDDVYRVIDAALYEDVGDGDHTSLATVPEGASGRAHLLIKERGVLAGIDMAGHIFKRVDPDLNLEILLHDGSPISPGDIGFIVSGPQQGLLKAERLVLNVMQRMSGIATETRKYADELRGLKTKILDTRKTTPGFRLFEKEAVRIGGGNNHRMGLYDMIMLKDNHIDLAGGIIKAIESTQSYLKETGRDLKVEIEARTIDDIELIISHGGVDRIMLDNFSVEKTKRAIDLIDGKYETESSGGITFETLRDYAECGVDYISVGVLTHRIRSIDMSMKVI